MADPVSLAINAALIAANMALTASQEFEGPRLDELKVTTADYGAPLSYLYGKRRLDGLTCIWAEPLTEVKRQRKTKGGKFNEYTYYGTWAVVVADHEIAGITRIWFDRNLIYDSTGAGPISPFAELGDITQFMTFYLGTASQDVDPRMAATVDAEFGTGSTPAYRGVAYIVFKDVPLEKLGNRLPQISVEAITAGTDAFPKDERLPADATLLNGWGLTWSHDRTRLYYGSATDANHDIWDIGARALMVTGEFGSGFFNGIEYEPRSQQQTFGITRAGPLFGIGAASFSNEALVEYGAEGLGGGTVIPNSDLVTCELQYATHCLALIEGPDDQPDLQQEIVIVFRLNTYEGHWYHNINQVPAVVRQVSTGGWQARSAFRTLDGTIKVIGGGTRNGQLAADECMIAAYGAFSGLVITMPEGVTGLPPFGYTAPNVGAYHYRNEALGLDCYIIGWKGITKDWLVQVDATTGTILLQDDTVSLDPYYFWKELESIVPGAASIWLLDEERSSIDLSVIRTYDISDWGLTYPGNQPVVYDAQLHALMFESSDNGPTWLYLDRVASSSVTLREIVEDVSERCGLTVADDIDATALTQSVQGYSWTQGTGKAILEPLLEAYDSEARPHDFELEFLRRGVAVGGAIPVAQMGAGGGVRYEVSATLDTDLPSKVSLTFADIDKDQQPNTALAQRSGSATDSRRELSLDASTLALDVDEARQKVDGYQRRVWMKAQTITLALTRAYTILEPGDTRSLVLDDLTRSAKLVRLEFGANGVLTTEWERYAVSIHTNTGLAGADADGLAPAEVTVFGYTKGLVLDIPLVTDADDATTPFVYLAAAPYSTDSSWPGATFNRGDDGVTFDVELGSVASSQAATIGYALSALPDALSTVWDLANAVTVKMFDGELTSATTAQVANGTNWAILGDEILGFTTATLIAEDTYQLSGLLRGRRGTERATGDHAAGDNFALLSGLPRAVLGASDVGDTIYVRPTTNGGPNGFPQTLDPFEASALKPYSPAHMEVEDSSGDKIVTWVRRTRVGGEALFGTTPPLGESTEAYVGQILDGAGAVIRTFSGLGSPSFTYTSAQQTADGSPAGVTARAMQVSSVVGNGYPADAAL